MFFFSNLFLLYHILSLLQRLLLATQHRKIGVVHQADDSGWMDGWHQLDQLLPAGPGSLLIFTSYTRTEANQDLARFLQYTPGCTVLLAAQPNPMSSRRPIRDWETDGNEDVFYANQYLSVVSRTPA